MEEKKFEVVRSDNGAVCKTYCSFDCATPEAKKRLYNITQSVETRLFDMINTHIKIKDVYCTTVEQTTAEGDVTTGIRTIIIDENGDTYKATSAGIVASLTEIFAIFGTPDTWETPLEVVVRTRTCTKGQTMYLEIV